MWKRLLCLLNKKLAASSRDNPLVNLDNRLTLNKQQALAFSQLLFQEGFNVWLLEGVTGSGKTEIYLQYIEEVLKKGKQVLVLVPEVGLPLRP